MRPPLYRGIKRRDTVMSIGKTLFVLAIVALLAIVVTILFILLGAEGRHGETLSILKQDGQQELTNQRIGMRNQRIELLNQATGHVLQQQILATQSTLTTEEGQLANIEAALAKAQATAANGSSIVGQILIEAGNAVNSIKATQTVLELDQTAICVATNASCPKTPAAP